MPTITVSGPLINDIETKRTLAKELTDVAERAYGIPAQHIVVVIKENRPENVSVGGELIIDRNKNVPK